MDIFEKRVQERAYFLWEQAGRPEGRVHEHWAIAARYELRIKTRANDIRRRNRQPMDKLANFLEAAEHELCREDKMLREAAYFIWLHEGCLEGRDKNNWFVAKHRLNAEGKLRKG